MFNKKLAVGVFCVLFLSGCSVVMSAKKSGVNMDEVGGCHTRNCILSKGATPISSKKDKNGNIIEETYQAKKATGSAARSVMHGALDVFTLGIWEVVGTPVEGHLNKSDYYGLKVTYNKDGETIKSIQIN